MLEDIKTLLEITDNTKDALLNIYIRKAVTTIKNYLNNSNFDNTYIEANFADAIVEVVVNAYNIKKNTKQGIKQVQQGQRNVVYNENSSAFAIDEDIKNLLPRPYIRLM